MGLRGNWQLLSCEEGCIQDLEWRFTPNIPCGAYCGHRGVKRVTEHWKKGATSLPLLPLLNEKKLGENSILEESPAPLYYQIKGPLFCYVKYFLPKILIRYQRDKKRGIHVFVVHNRNVKKFRFVFYLSYPQFWQSSKTIKTR